MNIQAHKCSGEWVDDGRSSYYTCDTCDVYRVCYSCYEYFYAPILSNERCCGECYMDAADIIQRWWKNINRITSRGVYKS